MGEDEGLGWWRSGGEEGKTEGSAAVVIENKPNIKIMYMHHLYVCFLILEKI